MARAKLLAKAARGWLGGNSWWPWGLINTSCTCRNHSFLSLESENRFEQVGCNRKKTLMAGTCRYSPLRGSTIEGGRLSSRLKNLLALSSEVGLTIGEVYWFRLRLGGCVSGMHLAQRSFGSPKSGVPHLPNERSQATGGVVSLSNYFKRTVVSFYTSPVSLFFNAADIFNRAFYSLRPFERDLYICPLLDCL